MSTIFPLSASVGQEFQGYLFDGTRWNLIGNEFNPTSFSSEPPANPQAGDLWVDSDSEVEVFNDTNLVFQDDLTPYLTITSASTTYATKAELQNIDLSSASAAAVAAIVDSAPATLDTLNELAAALNDDANFSSTVTTSLSNKLDASSASTTYLSKAEAYITYLTSASMQTVPVYVMNSGSSAQRPSPASDGMFRFNDSVGYPEWYDEATSTWWRFYQEKTIPIEYLVVAGGAGGGNSTFSGGGGAGGMLEGTSTLTTTPVTITVGSGGAAGSNGQNSVFSSITTTGGGTGGAVGGPGFSHGSNGGSGGGGTGWDSGTTANGGSGIAGQGNNGGAKIAGGGASGAGGGGANAVGNNASGETGGAGGAGRASSITGSSTYYAGGGGGRSASGGVTSGGVGGGGGSSVAGTVNTGGGGGANAAGGSGIVIIAYPDSYPNISNINPGLTYSLDTSSRSGYKVYRFTAGTGTVNL